MPPFGEAATTRSKTSSCAPRLLRASHPPESAAPSVETRPLARRRAAEAFALWACLRKICRSPAHPFGPPPATGPRTCVGSRRQERVCPRRAVPLKRPATPARPLLHPSSIRRWADPTSAGTQAFHGSAPSVNEEWSGPPSGGRRNAVPARGVREEAPAPFGRLFQSSRDHRARSRTRCSRWP